MQIENEASCRHPDPLPAAPRPRPTPETHDSRPTPTLPLHDAGHGPGGQRAGRQACRALGEPAAVVARRSRALSARDHDQGRTAARSTSAARRSASASGSGAAGSSSSTAFPGSFGPIARCGDGGKDPEAAIARWRCQRPEHVAVLGPAVRRTGQAEGPGPDGRPRDHRPPQRHLRRRRAPITCTSWPTAGSCSTTGSSN